MKDIKNILKITIGLILIFPILAFALEKEAKIDHIIILNDRTIEVTWAEIITDNGEVIAKRYINKQVYRPDADMTDKDAEIKAISEAIWTDEIKAEYEAAPKNDEPK